MLYIYDKQNKSLMPCKETEFKSHGLLERHDLAKWVEQNPTILGEELLIISSEYDRFDKTHERLDLLYLDMDGNLVVIELKRDDSGKTVDLQAMSEVNGDFKISKSYLYFEVRPLSLVSVDEIERLTGLEFFTTLSDAE